MKLKTTMIAAWLLMMLGIGAAAKKVHTLGDSTMAKYDESTTETRGWGMYFGQFLTNGWTSVNYAKGGRDARGGYNELWQTAKKNVEAGDYVIIQFAHNDENYSGLDNEELQAYYTAKGNADMAAQVKKDGRGSIPSTTYKQWLGKIIDEVKELGAHPILVAPVCRCFFSGNTITRSGMHDLGDGYSAIIDGELKENLKVAKDNHLMDYPYHMHELAVEKEVPFVDMTAATKTLYESYGATKCYDLLFEKHTDKPDKTHFNTTGALLAARLCAQLMKEQGILADNITIPADISVTPVTADLGQAYNGQTLEKEFTLSGFDLQPENGTISISASEGILLSDDKEQWAPTLNVGYTAGTLIQTFYAQVMLTNVGKMSGNITIEQGDKRISIPVSAEAIELQGGQEVNLFWRLESNTDCTVTGPATVINETWSSMKVSNYAAPKTGKDADGNWNTSYPDGLPNDGTTNERKTQRNVIDNAEGQWPAGEIDDNPGRYIDLGVKANIGSTLKIDYISMFVGGAGGNGMMCHVYYSTDGFETRTTLYAPKSMTTNTMYKVTAQPVISLEPGQELHLRVYPWYTSAATGKTICLSDVTIHGMAFSATGINEVDNNHRVNTQVYSVQGIEQPTLQRGLNIVRHTNGDGQTVVKKVMR